MNRLSLAVALLFAFPVLAEEPFGATEDVNGVRVFRAGGKPEDIGRAVGENFKEEIQYLFREYFETYTSDPQLHDKFVEASKELETHLSDAERAELEALAKGCELDYGKILIVHTFLDSIRTVNCSTFVLQPPATEKDQLIFGRNLDFPGRGVAHRHTVVMVFSPEGQNRFATVTWPGLQGALTGINEHGLALAVMNVYNKKDSTDGVPYVLLFRRILATCKTFDEAVKLMESSRRSCGNNLMIVDAFGSCGVLEYDHDKLTVRKPENGAVIATNHWRLEDKNASQTCPRWHRLVQLETLWHGKIGMSEAKKMLQAVPQDDLTLQSMLILPRTRELYLATGELPATKGKYRKVDGLFPSK